MNNHRHLRWALGAIVAASLVLGWMVFRRDAVPPPAAETAGPASAASTAVPGEGPHRPSVAPQLEPPSPAATPAPVKLPAAMQAALDHNPHLAAYYRLEQKVLPTGEDRDALHAMLSDPDLLERVVNDLLAPELMYTKDVEAKRLVAVEFLGDAAAWRDNPATGKVMEAVERVIFADNISEHAPEDLAQSLAGDKAELYTQLLHRSPDRAAVVSSHAQGTHVEALLAYSKRQYDNSMTAMRTDESQPH